MLDDICLDLKASLYSQGTIYKTINYYFTKLPNYKLKPVSSVPELQCNSIHIRGNVLKMKHCPLSKGSCIM
jgi:hypothetical protein